MQISASSPVQDNKDGYNVVLSEMGCLFIDSLSASWKFQLIGDRKTTPYPQNQYWLP
jgi:hypothetical protein